MSSEQPGEMRCPACGAMEQESIVQFGSYARRCAACRAGLFSASWLAIGPEWPGRVKVYRDGDEGAGPVLEGVGREISDSIGKLAADGTKLILRPVE